MPISSHELKHFHNFAFVETGCAGLGLGISSALKAGFERVYSVDINPAAYNECSEIFKNDMRVNITLGDCGVWLDKILDQIGKDCTIYLDANGWKNETESPIDSSLKALIRHGKKNHIILIDDMNHGKEPKDKILNYLASHQIVNKLREINHGYSLYLIDTHLEDLSHTFPSWVLVADPIKNRFPEMKSNDFVK
jgi:hypothetical protein